FQLLARGLRLPRVENHQPRVSLNTYGAEVGEGLNTLDWDKSTEPVKLTILADTSYGACCVDEIAAEHVDADAVVHYGRACLSPTARLPVIYGFSIRQHDSSTVILCI